MGQQPPAITGYLNFRDLGGNPTPRGTVKHGQVYRSDTLSHCGPREVEHLVRRLGVTSIIDLRHDAEITGYPLTSLEGAGVTVHHIPLVDPARSHWQPLDASASLGDRYEYMLDTAGEQFAMALRIIADDTQRPLVFQCMAGKDRTGLLAAVLLGLLGAADETITADYARTADALPAMMERWAAVGSVSTYDPKAIRPYLTADAPTMHQALDAIRRSHGTIERYTLDHGLSATEIDTLRAQLIDTGD